MTLSARAAANLQIRLYQVTGEALGTALELSAEAGPHDRLDEVLILIDDARAAVRAAIAAARDTEAFTRHSTGHPARPER
jgi:hypothetical protein